MTDVPRLVGPRPLADALAWRASRTRVHRVALVTDGASRVPAAALREAGLDVAGLLGPDALESLAWAAQDGLGAAYADLDALLADEVDGVVVDVPPPRSDLLLRTCAQAGLALLLSVPRTDDRRRLLQTAAVCDDAGVPHVVAYTGRSDEGYAAGAAALAGLGPVTQLTVLGWPAGGPPRAELVDLVTRWCGEVAAVCADPAGLPAASLGEDAPVTLALLTETGTTVLASERFGARQSSSTLTAVARDGRLVLQGGRLAVARDDGVRGQDVQRADAVSAMRRAGAALADDLPDGDGWPADGDAGPAGLPDLAAGAVVLAAVEESRREGGWVEL